jgi:hypothetical protein
MTEKEKLIRKLKTLFEIHCIKQKQYQEEKGVSPDCGCITREGVQIMSMWPQMQKFGITMDEVLTDG